MKTLYLVRHAKSSWETPGNEDHERPIRDKGVKRTQKIIGFLNEHNIKPGIIVSSHALRALQTARILASGLNYPQEDILVDKKLYIDDSENIMDVVAGLPDKENKAMLVGHNPCMTEFANEFLDDEIDNLPTSGVVSISFETSKWNEISLAEKKVDFVIYPKEL